MREALQALVGQRVNVYATVERYGTRPVFADLYEPTLLLKQVCTLDGRPLANHLWITFGVRLAAIDPDPGDVVAFTAWVRPYSKNKIVWRTGGRNYYLRQVHDYTLRIPSRVRKLAPQEVAPQELAP